MKTPQNWNMPRGQRLAMFILVVVSVPAIALMILQVFECGRRSGLKEAADNWMPKGSWSQSCDGLEVIVGEEWTTSFMPFSIGMGETYRIEMIAIKEGYDDLQPSAIMCELYPHKRCTWLADRGLTPDENDPYRTIKLSGTLKGDDGQIKGFSFYMDEGRWTATRKGDR